MEFERITARWIIDLEGAYANLDNDDPTMWGINSKIHPDLAMKISNRTLTWDEAHARLRKDYLYSIYGWSWLMSKAPDILWLLYIGGIHGSGDDHLVELFQRWFNLEFSSDLDTDGVWGPRTAGNFQALSDGDLDKFRQALDGSVGTLASRRANTVTGYTDSIKSRVRKEHTLAKRLRNGGEASEDFTIQAEDTNDGYVRIYHPRFEILIKEKDSEPESNINSGSA